MGLMCLFCLVEREEQLYGELIYFHTSGNIEGVPLSTIY